MSGKFVALLRGINVGGHKKIPMIALRALAEKLGYTDVQTYIQSGNLVFRHNGAASKIQETLQKALKKKFGFEVDVVVRSDAQWKVYLRTNPFAVAAKEHPKTLHLALTDRMPRAEVVEELIKRARHGEQIARVGDALWIDFTQGAGISKLTPTVLDQCAGGSVTARNWNTVTAVHDLFSANPLT